MLELRQITCIAKKEFKQFWVSTVGLVVAGGVIITAEFLFFSFLMRFNEMLMQRQALSFSEDLVGLSLNSLVVEGYFQLLLSLMVFFVPLMTMRSIAEERRQGTFEFLVSSPATILEIILGKFVGICIVVLIFIAITGALTFLLLLVGELEVPLVLSGLMALALCSCSFVAVGIAASALTSNQIVAAVIAMAVLLFFCLLSSFVDGLSSLIGPFLDCLSPVLYARQLIKGELSLVAVCYFISLSIMALAIAHALIILRRRASSAALQSI